jgi:poly-gamma-glutamate system protein
MKKTAVTILCVLSVAAFALEKLVAEKPLELRAEMIRAAELMSRATAAVRSCRQAAGVPLDSTTDVNRTGLLGLATSPITTSLGSLEAKRTSTNPNFAALAVLLLHQAGARRGDAVAVGASGSFPALLVASLCAARVTGVRPLVISSLGASEWGANDPRFDLLSLEMCLARSGLLSFELLACSLGGDEDAGRDMSPEGRVRLTAEVRASGAPLIVEPDLAKNVAERMAFYERAAGAAGVRAFVNIGGGFADLGTDSEILKVSPGLAEFLRFPPEERRGVIFAMAERRVPVIHLLYVKGLCDRYGLPWDPRPLPAPGEGRVYDAKSVSARLFAIIAAAYLAGVLAALVWGRSRPISWR